MGFSQEATVLMADGTWKNINLVKKGDYVMNKHGSAVRVMTNYKQLSQDCISFERGGSVTTIYATPDQKFQGCYQLNTGGNNVLMCGYYTPSELDDMSGMFKNTTKMFGTQNNIALNNFNGTLVSKDVWSIDVSGPTKSFFVNTLIAIEDSRI